MKTEELSKLEKALSETELRFQRMANCSPVLLWMSRTDSLCTFFNQTWLNFTGRSLEQEWGVGWAEGIHPADFQFCMDTYQSAFSKREAFEMEYRLRRHDGAYRWIIDRGVPRYDKENEFVGYIGSCIDITERREAESRLLETSEELSRSNEELEEFVYVIAHDLKAPIRNILMYTQFSIEKIEKLLPNNDENKELMDDLSRLNFNTHKLSKVIEDLMSFAIIGRTKGGFTKVDTRKTVEAALNVFENEIKKRNVQIELSNLQTITLNETFFHRLIQNLTENALKFISSEKVPHIKIAMQDKGSHWMFTFSDNGIGIDEKHASNLFRPFQKVHSEKKYPGTGIGLAVAKKIVEHHQGRIWFDSIPGQGTDFHFTIHKDLQHETLIHR